jgi:Ca2+-binding EF-hand superfamily protein
VTKDWEEDNQQVKRERRHTMVGSIGGTGGMSSDYISQMQDRLLKRVDSNSDGSVSKDEFVANRPKNVSEVQATDMWSELDTSNTGSLTASQFISAMASMAPPPGPPPGGSDDQSAISSSSSASTSSSSATAASELLQALLAALENYASTGGQDGTTSSNATQGFSVLFSKIDTNGDGSVSQDEFVSNRPKDVSEAQAKEMWSQLDTSNSGSLTESQFASAMASVGPPPGPPPGASGDQTAISGSSSASTTTATAASDLVQALLAAITSYTSIMNQSKSSSAATSTSASTLLTVA